MDQEQARALLEKYRLGKCTADEKALVEAWYHDRLKSARPVNPPLDMLLAEAHSRKRIWRQIDPEPVFEAKFRPVRIFYLAATVAAVLLIGFFWFSGSNGLQLRNGRNEMVTLVTKPGEITSYVLPDSSLITLNGGSNVQYVKGFNAGQRAVTITEGEAFFDVKHNPAKPFVVAAGMTKTQVLGTAFSIRAYQRLQNVSVTVARGKVSVERSRSSSEPQKAFLLPDDQLLVSENGQFHHTKVDALAVMSWIKGVLDFNNEDLGTITLLLEKKFNVLIHIDNDDLKAQRLTGKFKANETIDDILWTLGIAGNFKFSHQANEVLISMN